MLKILNRIYKIPSHLFLRGKSLLILGKEIVRGAHQIYMDRNKDTRLATRFEAKNMTKEKSRKNLEKNLTVPDPANAEELSRQTSLNSHIVIDHDPGEKLNSNMWQRNFNNHQGN